MRLQRRAIGLLTIAFVAGCGQPVAGPGPAMPEPATPFDPQVRAAREDLAQRLRIAVAEIQLAEARAVVWPDGSLGCPRPGMAYIQMLQDGLLIRLRAQGREFRYHGGRNQVPFLCEHPQSPLPGDTGRASQR